MDFSTLDKKGSEQLYLQIRRIMLKAIREGDVSAGQQVPSASELSEITGVSRMTVRQALQTLINEGWLYTVPGKGTFVTASPRVEQNLQNLMGWTEEIRAQGMQPATRLISVDQFPPDPHLAHNLLVPPGSAVYRITRLRLADGYPLSIEKAHLLVQRFPNLEQQIKENVSLYQVLKEVYSVFPVRAVQYLEAGEADRVSAELLDIPTGRPVLLSERLTYAADDELIEYVTGVTRPGFIRYKTELNASTLTMRQVMVKSNPSSKEYSSHS